MAAPYLIVGLAGDSNCHSGQYRLTDGSDDGGARIYQFNQSQAVVAANEPLDNLGYGGGTSPGLVGSTVALCRFLRDGGYLPTGYDILIVPHGWAGTAFAGYWATTGTRYALDGGGGDTLGFLTHLSNALATHANNRIWFFDWNHGANDGGQTQTQYQNNMSATWAEIRSTISTADNAPILVSGIPPDRYDPAKGAQVNLDGVVAAQANIANIIQNAVYIDPTGLHSDSTNGYVHFNAAAHRGGTDNGTGNTGEVVTNSLAHRKYAALQSIRYPVRLSWS